MDTEIYYVAKVNNDYLLVGTSFLDRWVSSRAGATHWTSEMSATQYVDNHREEIIASHPFLKKQKGLSYLKIVKVTVSVTEVTV